MNSTVLILLALAAGAAVGYLLAVSRSRARAQAAETEAAVQRTHASRVPGLEAELRAREADTSSLREQLADRGAREEALREQLAEFQRLEEEFKKSFKSLSDQALLANNEAFLKLAQEKLGGIQKLGEKELEEKRKAFVELTKPLGESISKVEKYVREVEKERVDAYSALLTQVKSLEEGGIRLQSETANLSRAMRAPASRGRWGEQTLRRVVEMAGLNEYCDFDVQQTTQTGDGALRPDMIVRLPNGRVIIVDSKAPLDAFMDAQSLEDDAARQAKLEEHAAKVRGHMRSLAQKSYWEHFEGSAEMVVMFLPAEGIFSAALGCDGSLIDYGADQKVLPASPLTLIALLRAVAYGWRQEKMAESAQKISEQGRELYERICDWMSHLATMGRNLQRTLDAYDNSIGSLERRVLPKAREFVDMGVTGTKEIPALEPIEKKVREIQAEEARTLPAARRGPPALDEAAVEEPGSLFQ